MSIQPLMVHKARLVTTIALFASLVVLSGCDRASEPTPAGMEGVRPSETVESDGPPLSLVPGDPRLKVGKKLLMAGRFDEALVIFDTVARARPDLARASFLKGMAFHGKKSHAQALEHYLEAEGLRQEFAERELLDYYIAWSAFYSGDSELSKARVEQCLLDNPERADPNFLAGLLAFNDDRLDAAERSLRRALEYALLEPEPVRSKELRRGWLRLSDVLARSERREEALEAIDNAISVRPDFAESWFRKASILSRLGREAEAEAALDRWKALGGGRGS